MTRRRTVVVEAGRRSNHEGTEAKAHASGGFYAHIQLDGKRVTVYGKTAAEVDRKRREKLRRHEDGDPLTDSRAKVAAWVQTWASVTLANADRAQGTKDQYADVLRRYVVPVIGDKLVAKVTSTDCEAVLLAMRDAGHSPSYRRLCYAAMRWLFKSAKSAGMIRVSPMIDVERPGDEDDDKEAASLSREQVVSLVAALAGHRLGGHRSVWLDIVQTGLLTGLRRGELLGLRWEDIDEVIELRQQTSRASDGLAQRRLKTKGSKRDIDVTPPLADVLRRRRKAQMADRLGAAGAWTETGLVFTTGVGTAIEPNNVNRAFRAAVRRAGLPTSGPGKVTPHTLRHSAATFLLESGVAPKEVQKILGHAKLATTMDTYAHVSPERRAAAMAKLGEALGW